MADKIKLLFLVSEFWQAGGERQAYEFNSVINRYKFEIDLFCLLPIGYDENKEDYYFSKHIELGSHIYFWDDFKKNNVRFSRFKSNKRIIREKSGGTHFNLNVLFPSYDFFLFFGEYTYGSFFNFFPENFKSRALVFIHNSRFQVPKNYTRFNKSDNIHFVSGFLEDEIKHELAEFESFNHTYIPLSINCEKDFPTRKRKKGNSKKRKIGLFTRLTIHKPLDVFYYALHLLLARGMEAELLVFGNGNPEEFEFNKCISYLGISEHIKFMGHQKEMLNAAVDNELDLVWFHSYYGVPGGYASFDICMAQIPQIFWDFTPGKTNNYYPEFKTFDNLDEFVTYSEKVLSNEALIEEIGRQQLASIKSNRNLNVEIKKIERLIENKVNDWKGEK